MPCVRSLRLVDEKVAEYGVVVEAGQASLVLKGIMVRDP